MRSQRGETSFAQLIAIVGVVLIAIGIAWLLAWNWNDIPSFLKILILVGATAGAYAGGIALRVHDYPKIGGAVILLGSLLFTLSVFLIAQIFNTDISAQGNANLLLFSLIGVLFSAYMFSSPASLIYGLFQFGNWLFAQFLIFSDTFYAFSPGYLALMYLLMGGLLYGLSLAHRTTDHSFASIYKWWTFAYLLAFSYILSFQTLQPMLWSMGFSLSGGQGTLLIILAVGMFASVAVGIINTTRKNKIDTRELLSAFGIFIALLFFVFLTAILTGTQGSCYEKSCYQLDTAQCTEESDRCMIQNNACTDKNCWSFREESSCLQGMSGLSCAWTNYTQSDGSISGGYCSGQLLLQGEAKDSCAKYENDRTSCNAREECNWSPRYWGGESLSGKAWFVWIVGNLVLLGMILLTLGHGTRFNLPSLVNLGIVFFALDIITRYIGFIIDLKGYLSLSLIFISGGIVLLVGGWALEHWRRSLLAQTK